MLFQLGLHDEYETWKAEAGRVIRNHAPQQAVWDFDRPNRYSLETMPAEGDLTTLMPGFWDPSHFRRELGDRVLDLTLPDADPVAAVELFTGAQASAAWAPDQGALRDLIAKWLAQRTASAAQAP